MLAVACVVFVARPFLREPAARPENDRLDNAGPDTQRRLALAEQRDQALAALKELEFDHRTGKVSDEDYRDLLAPLRQAAATALLASEAATGVTQLPFSVMSEQPTIVPEPTPVPSDPPQQPVIPEPSPVPHEPPGPVTVPEPGPTPVPEPTPAPLEPPTPQA